MLYSILTFCFLFQFNYVVVNSVLCEYGQSLKNVNDPTKDVICDTSKPCPTTHQCTDIGSGTSVCCPTQVFICSEELYQGTTCGTAQASSRFYFDSKSGSCLSFVYNGCFGNDNNFASYPECANYCMRGMCARGLPAKIGDTIQSCGPNLGPCNPGYKCTSTNVYSTISSVCCLTPIAICSKPSDVGSACPTKPLIRAATTPAYFYSQTSKTCETMNYNGCGGNENNFVSSSDCLQYCTGQSVDLLCPSGTKILNGSQIENACDRSPANGKCSEGFTCLPSVSAQSTWSYCCTSPGPSFYCPSGNGPFLDSITNQPVKCTSVKLNNCPGRYTCTQSKTSDQSFYCCPKDNGSQSFLLVWQFHTIICTFVFCLFVKRI